MTMRCRRCRAARPGDEPGLCRACYLAFGSGKPRPVPDRAYPTGLPQPTDALPGSPEKVRVMAKRAKRGLCLFHPLDAGWTRHNDSPPPLDASDETFETFECD